MSAEGASSDEIIGRTTSVEDVICALVRRGCPDLTSAIDLARCSTLPLDGGGFCDVYRGSVIHGGNIAIKSLRLYDRPGKEDEKEKILKRAARELYCWSKLKHPNIMSLMGLAMFRGHLSTISEWMENGNLMSYVSRNPNVDRVRLCFDLCDGLSYLHDNDLVHGDLKAANVMVSHDGIAMITDFGNSQLKDLTLKFTNTTSSNLTVRWAAPELLSGETTVPTREADVYAYGMTVLVHIYSPVPSQFTGGSRVQETLTGKVPFEGHNDQRVLVLVLIQQKMPDRPETAMSNEQWGILQDCWRRDQSQRPSIMEVKKRLGAHYRLTLSRILVARINKILIDETTLVEDLIRVLGECGCPNLTSLIESAACSALPLVEEEISKVYQGKTNGGTMIAIKSLKPSGTPVGEKDRQAVLKHAARELYCWSRLKHPSIMPLMGLAMFRGHLSMISEWMENGNLMSYVSRNPEVDRVRLCLDVCNGLWYLHANDLVHGDLKAANIMVSHDGTAMIGNFGNSRLEDLTLKFTYTTSSNLAVRWAAPELLLGEPTSQLTKEADVYAYGMTVLETLTGKVPFEGYNEQRVLVVVLTQQEIPDRPDVAVSNEQWEILQDCWKRIPSQRPNIMEVKERLAAHYQPEVTVDRVSAARISEILVDGTASVEDLIRVLGECGCRDLTSSIDLAACSNHPLAGGGFADVYRGRTNQGTIIAIKSLRWLSLPGFEGEEERKTIQKRAARELYNRSRLKHPNVLPLMGLAVFRGHISTISEWMENGDLMSYVRTNPYVDRFDLCVDICMGLSYLHASEMVHGDLKAANVLVSGSGTAMIGGFGNSEITDPAVGFPNPSGPSLSVRWAAPELLIEEDGPHLSKKADVYAYGMEVLTGEVPFKESSDSKVLFLIAVEGKTPTRPAVGVSDEIWEILQHCWVHDPSQRPDIAIVEGWLRPLSSRTHVEASRTKEPGRRGAKRFLALPEV